MKAVVDRIVQYANRYQLTNVETGEVLGTFDFEEVTGTVQQVGTEIDKELFDSIATDLAARVKLSGGELAGTIVTFSDISGTAANVASGDTSATLWGKVKNWFSRLKALAFKNKVASGDFEAGAIKDADVSSSAAIAQGKISGLTTDYVASISVSGRTVTYKNKNGVNMGSITTQDTTYGLASQSSNGLMSANDKTKLDGIESGAQKNTVLGVKGSSESAYRTGNVNITKANVGLGNVDNTADTDKPVSTAMQKALSGKANTSGTYPNLTVGKATNATNAETATAVPATLVPNNADLNDYRGENYWGKRFYASGVNTVQNLPYSYSAGFSLEVLKSGSNSTIQRLSAMTSEGNNIPTIYTRSVTDIVTGSGTWSDWQEVAEANGAYPNMKVGEAQALSMRANVSGAGQLGWYKVGTVTVERLKAIQNTNVSYSLFMLVNGANPSGTNNSAARSGIIEIDTTVGSDGLLHIENGLTAIKALCGNIDVNDFAVGIDSAGTTLTVYMDACENGVGTRTAFSVISEVYGAMSGSAFEFGWGFYGATAPADAVYATITNNASGDEDGNSIKAMYAKQSGTYSNMTVGKATDSDKLGGAPASNFALKSEIPSSVKLYRHIVTVSNFVSGGGSYKVIISVISKKSTSFTVDDIMSIIEDINYPCSGYISTGYPDELHTAVSITGVPGASEFLVLFINGALTDRARYELSRFNDDVTEV